MISIFDNGHEGDEWWLDGVVGLGSWMMFAMWVTGMVEVKLH